MSEVEPCFKAPQAAPKQPKRIPARSAKRQAMQAERDTCRAVVLARGACEYAPLIPEVECGSPWHHRPPLEVDEIRGGAYRLDEFTDPTRCRLTCQNHHDWKTAHKREAISRIEAAVTDHMED